MASTNVGRQMRIGELSSLTGVSIDAIRYYERRGVLPRAERTGSGYRVFKDDSVDRLRMVRQLQDLGFTLDEIVDALHAHHGRGSTCASERWRLEDVANRIDERINELQRTRRAIRSTLAACDAGRCQLSATR